VEHLDFGEEDRYMRLDDKKDPLVKLNAIIPWEMFRPRLRSVRRKPEGERKSNTGRKPWDEIVMFKAIILCALYNLSDEQVEYQMLDRLSFTRFLGLEPKDSVPDARTVWLYRDKLARAGVIEELFADFDDYLNRRGYKAMGGQNGFISAWFFSPDTVERATKHGIASQEQFDDWQARLDQWKDTPGALAAFA